MGVGVVAESVMEGCQLLAEPQETHKETEVSGKFPETLPFSLPPSPAPTTGATNQAPHLGCKGGGEQRFSALGPCWDSPLPSCANGGALPLIITTLFNWAAPACVRARVRPCLWEGGTLLTHGAPGGGVLAPCPPTGPLPQPGGWGGIARLRQMDRAQGAGGALTGCETARPGSPHDKGGGAGALISASRPGGRPGPRPAITAQRPGPAGARGPRRLIAQSSCRPGRGRAGGPEGRGPAHNEVCKKLICSATRSSLQSKAGVGRGQRGGCPGCHPEAGCGDPGFPAARRSKSADLRSTPTPLPLPPSERPQAALGLLLSTGSHLPDAQRWRSGAHALPGDLCSEESSVSLAWSLSLTK